MSYLKKKWNAIIITMYRHVYQRVVRSFRYKLMLIMIMVMLLPLLILILFAMDVSQNTFEREIVNSNKARIVLAGKYVDEKVRQADRILYFSLIDEKLVPAISQANDYNASLKFNQLDYIQDKLYSIYYGNENMEGISLYSKMNQKVYYIEAEDFRIRNMPSKSETNWTDLKRTPDSSFQSFDGEGLFSLTRSIVRFEDQQVAGGISVKMNWNMVDSVIDMLESEDASEVFLLNKAGEIIYNPDEVKKPFVKMESAAKRINKMKKDVSYIKTNEGYIFFRKAVHGDVIVVKAIPNSMVSTGAMKTLKFGILVSVLSIILTIILSILVALGTTRPIIRLVHAMRKVEDNNFEVKIETERKDEIGMLEKSFTSMIHRIKELIEKEYRNEIEKRNAKFMALQAQINPHFLYNTLQLVGGMAIANNAREIYSVISALSDMFRYITGKQGDIVEIRKEMEHLKNYLYIQNMRFTGNVETDIYVEEGLDSAFIPMLSIQPIVENAFKYGFEQKVGRWKLSIDVQKVFDEIEITITDNGIGIEEKHLIEIREMLRANSNKPQGAKGSIGIQNVMARIQLYYGDDYGLDILSEIGRGTKVIIRIPAEKSLEGKKNV
ncbi:sensor histidine kinase [Bacillus sp. USDA818B3_A]|uniref:sensor histidine kinase n=1 Tax=Bacillus sp. USDA818B3_A TaxID=2698834 RepID=UPI00136DBDD5|nr:histidine kinase [Bacillus sp. USDA818B3_A]